MVRQVRDRVCEAAGTLSGILMDTGDQRYRLHIQKILHNEKMMVEKEMKKINDGAKIDDHRTKTLLLISEEIEEELIREFANIYI